MARAMTTTQARYVVRIWIPGMRLNGADVDRGQLVDLTGAPNEERLLRLRYLVAHEGETYRCAHCGAEFESLGARTAHGDTRHGGRALPLDAQLEAADATNTTETPPDWDKTAARQQAAAR